MEKKNHIKGSRFALGSLHQQANVQTGSKTLSCIIICIYIYLVIPTTPILFVQQFISFCCLTLTDDIYIRLRSL